MEAQRIAGANVIMEAPDDRPDVYPLHVRCEAGCFLSAWKPTPDELAILNAGGQVLLSINSASHPPVALGVIAQN